MAFYACERNNMDPQINETEVFLSKIQNASLTEIYQFFGTNNSNRISMVADSGQLKLVLGNKILNTDEYIVLVENEYIDNIEGAPRALFVNTQTNDVVIGFFKTNIEGNEWKFYLSIDESIGTSIDLDYEFSQ